VLVGDLAYHAPAVFGIADVPVVDGDPARYAAVILALNFSAGSW
jgi:hypothetical protein